MDTEQNIQKNSAFPNRRGIITVDGCTLPETYLQFKNEIDNYDVHESDIWVCTFPKCGTTWTQEMVWLIANNLDFEGAKRPLAERFPFLELSGINEDAHKAFQKTFTQLPKKLLDSVRTVKALGHPAFIKTHLPFQLFPKEIREGIKKPKIIYVARDPRDVCVSLQNHNKLMYSITDDVTFDELCEMFLAGKVNYGPFWNHVLPFWNKRHMSNILFLKYENMKSDLPNVIKKISEFLEKPLSEEDVEKLTNHLSFNSMSKNPAVNNDGLVNFFKELHSKEHNFKFMRKGVAGDYKNVMTSENVKKFDEWIEKNISGTDYTV